MGVKRVLDIFVSFAALVVLSPIFLTLALVVWLQDYRSPFFIASRTGKGNRPYRMVKFRSMTVGADRNKVDSTAKDDPRITGIGRFMRKAKFDELPQLWNVLKGEMSLVGPRPNVKRETDIYTSEEKRLLSVRPGITDLASIVFSDEADILAGSPDPDIRYNQLIRPGKSRLGLFYVDHSGSVGLDLQIIWLTVRSSFDRRGALSAVSRLVARRGGDPNLSALALRSHSLRPEPPPGATQVVTSRDAVPA
jgi:lipopolysaccharide/colanic/teichoic acid biosynthesis glycosyltransferase